MTGRVILTAPRGPTKAAMTEMTLLDWFAGQALAAMVLGPTFDEDSFADIVATAYRIGSMMVIQRDFEE